MSDKKTILVIDDEEQVTTLLSDRLEDKGYKTFQAHNGIQGLEKLKEGVKPDLIILDLNMPEMGGIEFYSKICDSDGLPQYPIFVFTAREGVEKLFRDLHVDGFVTKPFETDDLLEEIEIVLEEREQEDKGEMILGEKGLKNITIIDRDSSELKKIANVFLDVGCRVLTATTAKQGMEEIYENPPDIALIQLEMKDIPGDIAISRLYRMAKTKRAYYFLYAKRDRHDQNVLENYGRKPGIRSVKEYSNPAELVEEVNTILQKIRNGEI